MKLQLEIGKEYVTESGEAFGPMTSNPEFGNREIFPFRCMRTLRSFKGDGSYANVPSDRDLVAEKPTSTQPTLDLRIPLAAQTIIESALNGSRGDAQQRLAQRGMQLTELLLQKNRDYGESAWKTPILAPGMTAREAIQCRMSDKVNRLQWLFAGNKEEVVDENVLATMMDLVGYGILWLEAPVE